MHNDNIGKEREGNRNYIGRESLEIFIDKVTSLYLPSRAAERNTVAYNQTSGWLAKKCSNHKTWTGKKRYQIMFVEKVYEEHPNEFRLHKWLRRLFWDLRGTEAQGLQSKPLSLQVRGMSTLICCSRESLPESKIGNGTGIRAGWELTSHGGSKISEDSKVV
eukprot:1138850-Pelagomonas_calceolata.AAC.1